MGNLLKRVIVQSRIWHNPDAEPIPDLDYDYSYPKTVYDAVMQNMDDESPTLSDELAAIYRLINGKQDVIDGGVSGNIMTWSGVKGQIGSMEVVKSIAPSSAERSHQKVVTERAIGDALDNKVALSVFNQHTYDSSIHITDVERTKWNQMAPLSSFNAHISNWSMHITETERAKWNSKADSSDFEDHIYNTNNPHNVTAHQTGGYSRSEIDDMFRKLRESFFNYKNIFWDDRKDQASLKEYDAALWNPNYVLEHGEALPDVPDNTVTYFALRPATDYTTNETQDCIIYIKSPGLTWREVGCQTMQAGDMVIKYPDTTMFVWVQGRFLKLFSGNSGDVVASDGTSDKVWKPVYDKETGILSWEQDVYTEAPESMYIKGEPGYTPIKGIDYVDGKDGEGVAVGGKASEVLVKLSDENYDTTWKTIWEIMYDMVLEDKHLPENVVIWDGVKGRPEWYDSLGDNSDGFITQRAATNQFNVIAGQIVEIIERIDGMGDSKQDLFNHVNDFNNPHRVTPEIIGAVSVQTFTDHTQNFNNPHNVTASQVGLGRVDNTPDLEKPISNATQEALDEIRRRINNIVNDIDEYNAIVNVEWDNSSTDLIFSYRDESELRLHIPIIDTFQNIYYDREEKELVIVLPNGEENRIDISSLIQTYFGSTGNTIQVTVENDNVIKAEVISGSIGEYQIAPSVHLRQSPTTTTQTVGDRSTRIATTEFVKSIVVDNLISYETDRPLSANMGRILNERKVDIDDVIQLINDIEGIRVVDSLESTSGAAALSANMGRELNLIKAPRVHTSPDGATYGRATISLFGHTRASDIDPLMDGTVFRGTDDGYFARGDHRHPTDITRAPIHWPDVTHGQYKMTGEPKADTPPDDSNDERIATTEWVRRNSVGVTKGYCSTETTNPYKKVELRSTFCDPPFLLLQIGTSISVTFRFEDRSGDIPTMLNINNTGWHPVLFGGLPITNGMLGAYHEHMFIFEGTYFRLVNPVPGTGYGTIVLGPGNPGEVSGIYMTGDDFTEENHVAGNNGGSYNNKEFDGNAPEDLNEEYNPLLANSFVSYAKTVNDDKSYTINQISGITGYTVNANDSNVNDHGEVEYVQFTIPYESRKNGVEIEFSEDKETSMFGAQMGDGTIIDLSDPEVISIGDSSAVVQFTLDKLYPFNSPCELIYKNNSAWIKITEVSN